MQTIKIRAADADAHAGALGRGYAEFREPCGGEVRRISLPTSRLRSGRRLDAKHAYGPVVENSSPISIFVSSAGLESVKVRWYATTPRNELSKQVELELITADTRFFSGLINPRLEAIQWLCALTLMPYLSTFVYESAKYLERNDPSAVQLLHPHQEFLLGSRMRVKLIEDKYRSSAEVLDKANELVEINRGWYLDSNSRVLAALKKRFLTDLGIYFMYDEILTTTHIAFLNMGLTKQALSDSSLTLDNLGPHLKDRMFDVGQYVRGLVEGLGIDDPRIASGPEISLPPIKYRDLKSQHFYESITNQVAPKRTSVSLLLTWMFSQINTARIIVPMIPGQNEVAAFKIRFVTLFQIASSLRKLLEDNQRDSFLKPDVASKISDMLNDDTVLKVYEAKGLRNNLVHYGVPKSTASKLSPDLPLFGLVEAHSNGTPFQTMSHEVALGLAYISQGIRPLLPQTLKPQGTV